MARPLRIEHPGARYHVTARGNEQRDIFRSDNDRFHFLELLSELSERFGIKAHAYVLMDNHFHLMLETPEANLSRAMQWLGVSYSVWFNRRHRRVGHLFQGRFKAVIVEDERGWQEVARYVHLNPVRLAAMELGKRQRSASRVGLVKKPKTELLDQRLAVLRGYRWSSYPGYAGYAPALPWVCQEPLSRLCGGRSAGERQAALRQYTEQAVKQGRVESPWTRLLGGMVLGTQGFAQSLRRRARGNAREQAELKRLQKPVSWTVIIKALETLRGEKWADLSGRHGDWARDAALWLGRRIGRLRLNELGNLAGGMDYAAVSQAARRFDGRVEKETKLREMMNRLQNQLLNV